MGLKVSFQGALKFTKLGVYLARTWPPSITATKWETIKYNIIWFLSVLSTVCFLIPLFVSMSMYYTDSLILTQAVTFAGGTTSVMIKMIIYRIRFTRTQTLIQEMEDFIKNAQPHEITVCRRYVDRCATFHIFISSLNYMATPMIICASLLFRNRALPANAVYPFPVDVGIGRVVAYLHQTFACLQCSTGVTIDCQAALMQWFAGARLDILADEVGVVKDIKELEIFVRKHRKLLAYAAEVSDTMAYIVITSTTTLGIVTITSCLQLCGNQPFDVKLQFAILALVSSINLFICAWPADNLINAVGLSVLVATVSILNFKRFRQCDRLEKAVYNTSWIDMSLNMMKNILIFLQRCQRPVIVSVGGFLPTLSLASYASVRFKTVWNISFLSATFSYFTTLRVVMTSDERK